MDVFALLFIVSFLALVATLVVMHIRKNTRLHKQSWKDRTMPYVFGDSTTKSAKPWGKSPTEDAYEAISQLKNYELSYDLSSGKDSSVETKYKVNENGSVEFVDCRWNDESWMKRGVNKTREKWKETVPKHSTRIKLRNKRKGKK